MSILFDRARHAIVPQWTRQRISPCDPSCGRSFMADTSGKDSPRNWSLPLMTLSNMPTNSASEARSISLKPCEGVSPRTSLRIDPPVIGQAAAPDDRASATIGESPLALIRPPVCVSIFNARCGGQSRELRSCESRALVTPMAALSAVMFMASGRAR